MSSTSENLLTARISEISVKILILKEKLETIRAEIELLNREKANLHTHVGFVNSTGVESSQVDDTASRGSLKVKRVVTDSIRYRRLRPKLGSIKADVLKVLNENPDGLLALDILRLINGARDEPLERTSLSPQLSRLQRDGLIANDRGVWRATPASNQPRAKLRKVDLE